MESAHMEWIKKNHIDCSIEEPVLTHGIAIPPHILYDDKLNNIDMLLVTVIEYFSYWGVKKYKGVNHPSYMWARIPNEYILDIVKCPEKTMLRSLKRLGELGYIDILVERTRAGKTRLIKRCGVYAGYDKTNEGRM